MKEQRHTTPEQKGYISPHERGGLSIAVWQAVINQGFTSFNGIREDYVNSMDRVRDYVQAVSTGTLSGEGFDTREYLTQKDWEVVRFALDKCYYPGLQLKQFSALRQALISPYRPPIATVQNDANLFCALEEHVSFTLEDYYRYHYDDFRHLVWKDLQAKWHREFTTVTETVSPSYPSLPINEGTWAEIGGETTWEYNTYSYPARHEDLLRCFLLTEDNVVGADVLHTSPEVLAELRQQRVERDPEGVLQTMLQAHEPYFTAQTILYSSLPMNKLEFQATRRWLETACKGHFGIIPEITIEHPRWEWGEYKITIPSLPHTFRLVHNAIPASR